MKALPSPSARRRARYGLLLLLVLLCAAGPSAASADADGSVSGVVLNQTTGQPVAGAVVTLSRFEGNPPAQTASSTATTAADGSYRFDGLDTSDGIVYVTSTTYQTVLYSSGMIQLKDAASQQKDIAVYDTTTDSSLVSVTSRGLVLSNLDSSVGQLAVLDIIALQMDGNVALVPDSQGRTTRFAVPANALDVTPLGDFDYGTPSIEDTTVFATAPLRPGASSATLGYTLPYQGASLSLQLDATYPTQALRVLVPTSGGEFNEQISVNSPQFADGGLVTISDKQYHLWTAQNIPAGQQLALTINNLPNFEPNRNRLNTAEPALLVGFALLLATALTTWVVMRRGLYRPRPVVLQPQIAVPLEERRVELAEQLRALENDHALGRVAGRPYEDERRAILEQLRHLSRQARGIGADE
jgi:5-hydroxyisourate hydrolase-like protein (transthyretin family)